MNLRRSRRDEPEINLIPLIDILFFLLLFFMLSTTFKDQSLIRIDLPKASQQQQENQDKPIDLTIDVRGNFYVNGKRVVNTQIETLKRALQIAIGEREHPPLTISADGMTPHQAVVTAMDAARQVGLLRLSIATKNATEGGR